MNLLLLLSALISALTGVGGGVRDGQAVQAVAERRATAVAAATVVRTQTIRPVMSLPTLARQAFPTAFVLVFVNPFAPIYASRRRE
ncbi:conserved hypothetical protein [Sphingomonas sp. EC-HK361]|uniref:hypothetical protein n=1 Tax=Sphingomonas sp. EC-HK361 TaxID=2038397 RepID=UPI001252A980|nr:hypothetical protein [Sphingomonas sp. EC-HK361]VVT06133.1 conserved hypothetical protein [Sphingomonas sp. EC-HK361]